MFSLPLAVVGFEFGTVTGPVYASLLPGANNSLSSLGGGQHVRQIDYTGCTQLNFSVNSINMRETVVLTTNVTKIFKREDPTLIPKWTIAKKQLINSPSIY